ncbi:MAG TPA: HU family DNA-binding protein [Candidatus Caccosoma faecigallinarum]|jgi:histone family protein DNA-binding protein|uniref:HU family DNA-binding protein n=1 Tax=Candidatus Caccosoma faecigallinarum TaxID=2840720 RepID=A0A9D1GA28_9FIRM|nr:putative HU-related DNA-binding protein [Firmicutes bacterium CAG:631]HIT17538.1 HU family DNA-binding protein [Candidatus Caccosoma faecigallinarum]
MNKQELAAKISEAKGITKVEATRVVDAVFETIVEELKAGEMVKIPGFGNFVVKTRKARTAVIPLTNKKVIVPSYKTVGFKPAKSFKEQVK